MNTLKSPQDPVATLQQHLPQPFNRALRMNELGWQLTHSLWRNQIAAVHLLTSQPDLQLWQEMLEMQQAVFKRMQEQQQEWMHGVSNIVTEYSEMKRANTLSKLMEQECNMVNQLGSLASSQLAAWIGMLENIQIGYSWWLNQKQQNLLEQQRQTPAGAQGELVVEHALR